jgi:hypothetical protein
MEGAAWDATPGETKAADSCPAGAVDTSGSTVCNMMANEAPMIWAKTIVGPPPTSRGGTIVDGIYHLKDLTTYARAISVYGPSTDIVKMTLHIRGDRMETIELRNCSLLKSRSYTLAQTDRPTNGLLTVKETCPPRGKVITLHYEAKATSFIEYFTFDDETHVWTFIRQTPP